MSIASPPAWVPFQMPPFPVRRFTVDEYHHMIETGLLTEEDHVELLEGWITPKMPPNPLHDGTIQIMDEVIKRYLPPGWGVRVQSAITTLDSEPEPDLAVVRGDGRAFLTHHPRPHDIGTLIEVAESSLSHDRTAKGRLYAGAGVGIYWIINLADRQIEVHTDPTGPEANPVYRHRQVYGLNDAVPLVLDGTEVARIPVSELLPASEV